MPTASPIGGVPASNLYGRSFQLVSSTVTFRIISPPKLKGDILSSSSARPQSTPTPVGPQTLCEEKARKSQPSAWTSIRRCGAACAASTTMIAPCSRPRNELLDRVDRPESVRDEVRGDDLDAAFPRDRVERVELQLATTVDGDRAERRAGTLRDLLPGHEVRVVLELGRGDEVAGAEIVEPP